MHPNSIHFYWNLLETSYLKGWPSLFKCTNIEFFFFFFNSALAPQYLLNNYLFQVLVQKDEIKWYKKAKRVRIQVESDKKWLGLQTQTKTDFSFAWKIPWTEEPGRLQSMWPLRVRHDWATLLSLFTFMHWRRKWQPTPVFLPGESQGRGSMVGCCLLGCTESDTTEAT